MNLTISGHHPQDYLLTCNLRHHQARRITRHFDQVVDVKVLLTVETEGRREKRQRAECNIHYQRQRFVLQSAHSDLYAAVDELVDKLDCQIGAHKDRLPDHHHEAVKRELQSLTPLPDWHSRSNRP